MHMAFILMNRTVLAALLVLISAAPAKLESQALNLRDEILSYRITAGPWRNAFRENREAAGFRYYFVSSGLRAVVLEPTATTAVEAYLDLCIEKSDLQTGLWDDVPDLKARQTILVDADDSNAAMLILLATDFYSTKQGKVWWAKHSESVKKIATHVLLENRLPVGLVSVYSHYRNFDDPKYDAQQRPDQTLESYRNELERTRSTRKALQSSAYLMDSCEVYGALHALAEVLKSMGDGASPTFLDAAVDVANGIARLFDEKAGAFFILDADRAAYASFYPSSSVKFYPHRLAQIFPQLYDVSLGREKRFQYDRAWSYATANDDWQARLPLDTSSTGFPAMLRGCAAMKRGDYVTARKLLDWYLGEVRGERPNVQFLMINEVGCALSIENGLKRHPNMQRPD